MCLSICIYIYIFIGMCATRNRRSVIFDRQAITTGTNPRPRDLVWCWQIANLSESWPEQAARGVTRGWMEGGPVVRFRGLPMGKPGSKIGLDPFLLVAKLKSRCPSLRADLVARRSFISRGNFDGASFHFPPSFSRERGWRKISN